MSIKVKFSAVDEFLEELVRDNGGNWINRGIVRATAQHVPSKMTPNIRLVYMVATYRRGDEIVELRRRCGDYWVGMETEDNEVTMKKYEVMKKEIEEVCDHHELDNRAGMYESVEP